MNKQQTTLQFFKDGLPGAIIAALIYFSLWESMPLEGIFFVLVLFIGTGFNTRFIKRQNIQTRKDWAVPILKMIGTAWLVTLPLAFLCFIFASIKAGLFRLWQQPGFHHVSFSQAFFTVLGTITNSFMNFDLAGFYFYYLCIIIIIGSIIGLLIGFIITYLMAIIFYPQKSLTYMFIPIIVSLSIIISIGFILQVSTYS